MLAMCNCLSSFFEIVFAVFLVLKFGLVSWQLNGKVKVWDNFGFCSAVHGMDGDNYLLSRVVCWHQTPAYRTGSVPHLSMLHWEGIAPNDA